MPHRLDNPEDASASQHEPPLVPAYARRSHAKRVHMEPVEEGEEREIQQAPISCLPSEIFLAIFVIVKAFEEEPFFPESPTYGWIVVTHVCKLWRNIALEAPQLWAEIIISSRRFRWAFEMLRRSKLCPLTATVDLSTSFSEDHPHKMVADGAISTLRKNLWRCRALNLRQGEDKFPRQFLEDAVTTSAHLRSFSISLRTNASNSNFTICDETLKSQCLQRLCLSSCDVDWSTRNLNGLTHLKLRKPVESTRRTFWAAIANMPHLESLDVEILCRDYNSTAPVVNTPSTTYFLPSLKHLHLEGCLIHASYLLSTLTLTSILKIGICSSRGDLHTPNHDEAYHDEAYQDHLKVILSQIATHFSPSLGPSVSSNPSMRGPCLQSCQIFTTNYHELDVLRIFRDALSQDQLLANNFDPVFEIANARINMMQSFVETHSPLAHLVSLQMVAFGGECSIDADDWLKTFGTIPTLQSIFISEEVMPSFFEALVYGLVDQSTIIGNSAPIPFPALSSLTLHLGGDYYEDEWKKLLPQTIVPNLRFRRDLGLGVEELIFMECATVSDAARALLSLAVTRIVESGKHVEARKLLRQEPHCCW